MPAPSRHSQQFRHRAEVAGRADTMKLSRAILVVILMHVVAVGGVLAFSLLHEPEAGQKRTTEEGAGAKKKADLAPVAEKAPRKTAPTQGIDAPSLVAAKPAPGKSTAPQLVTKPAVVATPAPDSLEREALSIIQGGAPARPATPAPRAALNSARTPKPDVRPAANTRPAGAKKEDPKSRP